MLRNIVIACLGCVNFLVQAEDFPLQRLQWQCESGSPASIEAHCLKYVQGILDWSELDEGRIKTLLEDKDLTRVCYITHFFSLLRKGKVAVVGELKDKDFTRWLMEHPELFQELVFADKVHHQTLPVIHAIWLKEDKKLGGLHLTQALAASIAAEKEGPVKALDLYDFYKTSQEKGNLYPQFSKLEAWEMGILFTGRADVEELHWAQEYLKEKGKIKPSNIGSSACGLIPYRDKNKDGISVHKGGAFYDHQPITLQIYVEYGGVCGAVSKGSCGFCRAKGVPAYDIGQPGHCALLWKGEDGTWKIGNNIYGWNWSYGGMGHPWGSSPAELFSLSRFINGEKARESSLCYYLSPLSKKEKGQIALLEQAVIQNPANLPAWKKYADIKLAKASESDKIKWLKQYGKNPGIDSFSLKAMVHKLLPERSRARLGYNYCSLLLMDDENNLSQEIFMREFWAQASKDYPELRKAPAYGAKTKKGFLQKWVDYHKKQDKFSLNERKQTVQAMEKAIVCLIEHEKTCGEFMEAYRKLVEAWGNKKFIIQAENCFAKCLELTTKNEVRLKAAGEAIKLTEALGDKKKSAKYRQLVDRVP